jgi:CheY-like chemotaxis protein
MSVPAAEYNDNHHGVVLPPELMGRGERILHVDDEAAVTSMINRLLTRIGYSVESFTQPDVAVARLRAAPTSFDVVITDLMMPKMDGIEVALAVQLASPGLPVVLLSAFSCAHDPDVIRACGIDIVLNKPVGINALATAIRKSIDNPFPKT